MSESGIFRFRNLVLNMNHIARVEYCLKQIYIKYDDGEEQIITDAEICAAFFEYMGGVFPDLVDHDSRQMAMYIAGVARRKIYAEALIIDKKITATNGVEFTPGPGFAGHQPHPPMTTGGDPANSPGLSQHIRTPASPPPKKKGCCGGREKQS